MRSSSVIITAIIFFIILSLGSAGFLFWRLGILKQEVEPTPTMENFKNELENIKKYMSTNLLEKVNLQNLPVDYQKLPEIQPNEIGRKSLFE